jgi:hypothetical protein
MTVSMLLKLLLSLSSVVRVGSPFCFCLFFFFLFTDMSLDLKYLLPY